METLLDPKSTAVVLIDLQQSTMAKHWEPLESQEVMARCLTLAEAVRKSGGTVVFIRVLIGEMRELPVDAPAPKSPSLPDNACDLVPEVPAGDFVVTKRQWGAFYGTELEQILKQCGVKTIILGGVATNLGVESTARAAHDRGYELVFVEDAMASFSKEAHEFAVKTIFPRMGRVRSVARLITALAAG